MMMQFTKKHGIHILLLLLSSQVITSSYAFSFSSWHADKNWHPVLSIGSGLATSSDLGRSQFFPIQNPDTDEFYNYSVHHATQSSVLLDGFIGMEWYLCTPWLLQTGIDYNQATPFSARGSLVQGVDAESADLYNYHYSVSTKQLLIEGKLLYTFKALYHPYIMAGVGESFNKTYNYYTSASPFLTFTRMYADHSTTSFSYRLGLGIDIDMNENVRLGIGYRFTDLGRVKLGNATIDTTSVGGTLSQSHFYTNEVLMQFTLMA